MAKKASKKKRSSSKKKQSGNVFTKILTIIFIVVFVGFIAFKYFPKTDSKKNQKSETQLVKEKKEQTPKDSVIKPEKKPDAKPIIKSTVARSIEGCWMSTTGGAVLTMKDFEYRIDFMGVDSGKPIVGTYLVEDNTVTFSNRQEPCIEEKGIYEVDFNKQEISFRCKDDGCTKRRSTLVTDWEWLDE